MSVNDAGMSRDVARLRPHDRRLLVVSRTGSGVNDKPGFWRTAGKVYWKLATYQYVDLYRMAKSLNDGGLKKAGFDGALLAITPDEAEQFNFSLGHPQTGILYVMNPAETSSYIVSGQFHAILFEQKVAEALKLIRSLGAKTIVVERIEGWGQETAASAALHIPTVDQIQFGASVTHGRSAGRAVMTSMTLRPSGRPRIPDGMIWLPYEPLWKELAEARLASGLKSFQVDVKSTDDYGINSSLKLQVLNAGLGVGGSFIEHRSTIWRLEGTFA